MNFRQGFTLVLLSAAVNIPAMAMPEALPGSIWLSGSRDLNGIEGYGTMGHITQGIQWFSIAGEVPVTTYGAYNWRIRDKNRTYFDAHGPSAGLEISKFSMQLGVAYNWLEYSALNLKTKSFEAYFTTYQSFDFISGDNPNFLGIPVHGFPTTLWMRISNDFQKFEGVGTMGFINQGIDWFKLPGSIIFRTLAAYHWRFRSLNRHFYSMHGPGVGIELSRSPITFGAEYAWMKYPEMQKDTKDFRLYLTAYFDWDLKP